MIPTCSNLSWSMVRGQGMLRANCESCCIAIIKLYRESLLAVHQPLTISFFEDLFGWESGGLPLFLP